MWEFTYWYQQAYKGQPEDDAEKGAAFIHCMPDHLKDKYKSWWAKSPVNAKPGFSDLMAKWGDYFGRGDKSSALNCLESISLNTHERITREVWDKFCVDFCKERDIVVEMPDESAVLIYAENYQNS